MRNQETHFNIQGILLKTIGSLASSYVAHHPADHDHPGVQMVVQSTTVMKIPHPESFLRDFLGTHVPAHQQ